MSRSPEEQKQDAESSLREHHEICTCRMCMSASRLSSEQVLQHREALKSTMVDRRNPDNPTEPLMKAIQAHAIISCGASVNMMEATGLTEELLPENIPHGSMRPEEMIISAEWRDQSQERGKSGRNASVFGGLGVLLTQGNAGVVNIPIMEANCVPPSFLEKYGAKLVNVNQAIQVPAVTRQEVETLYLVQYDFHKKYIEEYVMHLNGGGGCLLKRIPFLMCLPLFQKIVEERLFLELICMMEDLVLLRFEFLLVAQC